jgi:hypothetical protein
MNIAFKVNFASILCVYIRITNWPAKWPGYQLNRELARVDWPASRLQTSEAGSRKIPETKFRSPTESSQ